DVDQLEQRVSGVLDPGHLGFRPDRGLEPGGITQVHPVEVQPGSPPAHAFEQAVSAAVDVVHGNHVAAAVQQFEQGGGGGHAGGEREAAAAALKAGYAALVGEAGRVVGTRVLEALVLARTRLGV